MRICTLNVHEWADASFRANRDRVLALLREIDADAIGLQEVSRRHGRDDVQDWLAEELGMHATDVVAYDIVNTVLTRAVPSARFEFDLSPYRGAAVAVVPSEFGEVAVCCTHLDHVDESRRMGELETLREALGALPDRVVGCFVMGDFNALDLRDYQPARLAEITEEREDNGWEPPEGVLLEELHDLGWVDLAREGLLPRPRVWHARKPLPVWATQTSRFDTRIDYVFATPRLASLVRVTAVRVPPFGGSDHNPVVIDLAPVSAAPKRRRKPAGS
jgi:endonuclease/exonuclease/phosphatase family metal-dependent hydrolase